MRLESWNQFAISICVIWIRVLIENYLKKSMKNYGNITKVFNPIKKMRVSCNLFGYLTL